MPIGFTGAALLPFYANEQCPAVAYESLSPALKKPAAKPSVHKKKPKKPGAKPSVHKKKPNQNKPKTYQKPENKPKTHQNKPKTTGSQVTEVTGRPYQNKRKVWASGVFNTKGQTENEPKTLKKPASK